VGGQSRKVITDLLRKTLASVAGDDRLVVGGDAEKVIKSGQDSRCRREVLAADGRAAEGGQGQQAEIDRMVKSIRAPRSRWGSHDRPVKDGYFLPLRRAREGRCGRGEAVVLSDRGRHPAAAQGRPEDTAHRQVRRGAAARGGGAADVQGYDLSLCSRRSGRPTARLEYVKQPSDEQIKAARSCC
jgi:hypothetical protein